jgi:hypothetical protein
MVRGAKMQSEIGLQLLELPHRRQVNKSLVAPRMLKNRQIVIIEQWTRALRSINHKEVRIAYV